MEPSLDRRLGRGRRRSDAQDTLAGPGLLHDLGHQRTTLSYLVEAVRGDVDLPEDAGFRLELLSLEMTRLLDVIAHEMPGRADLVGNAARAAGPAGRVEITVGMLAGPPPRALLQVQDNGPGFGHGPPGAASLGLGVVTRLLESCRGSMEVEAPADGDVLVRIMIPAEPIPPAAPDRPPANQVST